MRAFLGAFSAGTDLILRVTWTTADDAVITGSTATITPPDGLPVVVEGVEVAPNAFEATVNVETTGRHSVEWDTEPAGGSSQATFYTQ